MEGEAIRRRILNVYIKKLLYLTGFEDFILQVKNTSYF